MERDGQLADLGELLDLAAMTLATMNEAGEPHAAPVYFAAGADLRLYFFSSPDSRHGQDLARSPQAASAIYPECFGWQEIRGVQMHGIVHKIEPGADWEHAWELYRAKFPFAAALGSEIARNALYAFTPHWIRLVDNRRGFGYKREWTLD
jgi:hypothetical protein